VATDSEEIAAAVRGGGGEAVLTSAEHPSGTDRVAEVAALPAYRGYDAIVNVQGDEPFVDREAVLGAAAMVSERGFPLGTAAAPADTSILEAPHVVKVVAADDGRAMYFSRRGRPCAAGRPGPPARRRVCVCPRGPGPLGRAPAAPARAD
jgi:3-deoxy-manno-octulosonate cytidylyltransferase (CMP-KDO synthetase)